MDKQDLDDVYGAKTPEESRAIYDNWSTGYDADCLSQGFRLPGLGAALLGRYLGETDAPVLDACCGTGLVGETLRLMEYGRVVGCDLSPDMLKFADRTGAYEQLEVADTGVGLPFDDDAFAGFVCVGAFGPGHAPPVTLEHLARVTRPGGIGVFNLLDATYEEQGFPPVLDKLAASGAWEVIYTTPSFRPFLLAEPELLSTGYVVRMR
ncbi:MULTISPECIES: class I SAM-dependent DNA methyltransferase [Roseovarius]|jgi:SAM-dependent methyltransferase|uniref:class I SAM-dependent DNA methyltransferase n=1 Tax=Roseovarius TaxID=74030 RepID=UPI00273FB112|nr:MULTISPECIES: class I SAM-dependent methyltransferase [unclassified Roseovarius]